jgi:hypothetical protein
MLRFFQKRALRNRRAHVLKECEEELDRVRKIAPVFPDSREILRARADLLTQARAIGLSESSAIKQLDFFHRLRSGLATSIEDQDVAGYVREAQALGLQDNSCVRYLREHQRMLHLKAHGPEIIETDSQGRAIYVRCDAEHKNKPGRFEVRDDGISFGGEVAIQIPWTNVAHVAKTTHTYRGYESDAIAVQEGKRRTATIFAFHGSGAAVVCETVLQVWKRQQRS